MAVKPIPEGFHSVTPYLLVSNGSEEIEFLKRAFGARETFRGDRPDGSLMHASVMIGDSMVELGEPMGELRPMPAALHVYVPDVDAVHRRALEAGATSIMEPQDQFYGDREGGIKDPAGNHWFIATHKEDVPDDELERRTQAFLKEQAAR